MRTFLLFALAACHRPADTDTDTPVDTDTGPVDTGPTTFPPCDAGSTFVTWSRDGGATLAPVTTGPDVNTYTWSIAIADDAPAVLIAEHGGTLWRSTDAGCTFDALGTLSAPWWDLHTLGGGEVWGHVENGTAVVHVTGDTVDEFTGPGGSLLGMTLDHGVPVVGDDAGALYALDGRAWTPKSSLPGSPFTYDWAFDPKDARRAVAGTMSHGLWWTHDGETWQAAAGIHEPTNVFSVAWSPVDPDVVWAEGLDIAEADAQDPSQGRHVWRSTDGGQSFAEVLDNSATLTLTNGLPMTPDPIDANVLWFEFGTSFQGEGTYLYRYDHGTGQVTTQHHPEWDEFRAITFSPADPTLLYFAVVNEQID